MIEIWGAWAATAVTAGAIGGGVGFNVLVAMAVAALLPWAPRGRP